MGYETKVIIGTKNSNNIFKENGCNWLNVIAEIDLCKSVFYDTYIDKEKDTEKMFIYGSDGNTKITKDSYNSPLFAIEPKKVLEMMLAANKIAKYRRYNAAIAMLKSLIKDFKGEDLTCILYGH
jgi:hypothetical protein